MFGRVAGAVESGRDHRSARAELPADRRADGPVVDVGAGFVAMVAGADGAGVWPEPGQPPDDPAAPPGRRRLALAHPAGQSRSPAGMAHGRSGRSVGANCLSLLTLRRNCRPTGELGRPKHAAPVPGGSLRADLPAAGVRREPERASRQDRGLGQRARLAVRRRTLGCVDCPLRTVAARPARSSLATLHVAHRDRLQHLRHRLRYGGLVSVPHPRVDGDCFLAGGRTELAGRIGGEHVNPANARR